MIRLTSICPLLLSIAAINSALAGTVVLSTDGIMGPIGRSLSHFVDTTGSMSFEQVMRSGDFRTCDQAIPRYPVSKSTHWLSFLVENKTNEPALSVSVPYAALDMINVYLFSDQREHLIGCSGLRVQHDNGERKINEYSFDLPLPPGSKGVVFLQLASFKPIHVPVMLATKAALIEARAGRSIALGAYLGIMLVLALYNLFIYLSTKDRNYSYYVLSILAVCAAQLSLQGTGPFDEYFRSEWITPRSSLLFSLVAIPLGLEFARKFINTRAFTPVLHRLTPILYGLIAVIGILFMIGDPWLGYELGQTISGISALFLLTMIIVSVRKGSRQARFFLLAWTGFLVGVVLFVLKDEGVLPYNNLTVYAMPVGSVIEGVLLSFGLADRINILRKEKERSQAEALASSMENERMVRDQNVTLEHMVTERTHQLQDSLTYLKQTQSQLVEAEKMSSLGQLTAGIAHEINNPINFIKSNIPPLKRDLADVMEVLAAYRAGGAPRTVAELEERLGLDVTIIEVGKILQSMEVGANRTAEIVSGLRTFSRLDEGDMKYTDINDGIRSTLDLLTLQLKDRINVELDMRANESVECLPGKMNQVFMNLLSNAIHAVNERHGDKGGRISVVTEQLNDHLIVTITDNGIGMNEATRARVFEPFFTTKAVGDGTGLGLSIVHSIIEKHNGRIEVDSIQGQGTEFRVILPNSQPQQLALRA